MGCADPTCGWLMSSNPRSSVIRISSAARMAMCMAWRVKLPQSTERKSSKALNMPC